MALLRVDPVNTEAARELAWLQEKVAATRALLTRLTQSVAVAEDRAGNGQAAQLLEANEQLVVSAVLAQAESAAAERTLTEVSLAAKFDALTDLPNRELLLDRFTVAIANATRHRTRLALLFLDLNNFKQINDTFGHAVGDEMLMRAASNLASSVRAGDTVSRHGGDEFLVLLAEVTQASDAVLVADKMIANLGAPSYVGEHMIRLTVSIGISIFPDDGKDAAELIECADAAMYRAKKHGVGSFVFHGADSMSERTLQLPALVLPTLQVQNTPALSEHERRHAQLQEANQRLILAVFNSQELQDAAEQAQRRQTQLLATVANALRDPLEPLRVATATLGRLRGNEPLQPQVQAMIELQVGNMSRLVDKLVSLTRVNAARMTLESRVIAMGPIVDAAIKTCRPAMELRLQQLEVLLPEDSLEVQGDPVRLTQVLSNLLGNASKYSPNGGRIELQLMAADDTVAIRVSDNGIGITAEALPRVFASFTQDPHANDFTGIAPGLGLREVRELVEAHGGTVVASSEGRERGSQFTVTLPLAIHHTRH